MTMDLDFWSRKFDNIIRKGNGFEWDQLVISETNPKELDKIYEQILERNDEKPTVILFVLNKVHPNSSIAFKFANHNHPKIRKKAASLLEMSLDKAKNDVTLKIDEFSQVKYLDFLHFSLSRIVDSYPTLDGLQDVVNFTIDKTIEYFSSTDDKTVPKSYKESLLQFFSCTVFANKMKDYDKGVKLLSYISQFANDLVDLIPFHIPYFYIKYYKERDLLEKICTPLIPDKRVLLSIARLEYDSLHFEYTLSTDKENYKPSFVPFTSKYAKEMFDVIIDDLGGYSSTKHDIYDGISNDLYKLCGIAAPDILPKIIIIYQILMSKNGIAQRIQAFKLMAFVGSHRFFTNDETEEIIKTFCKLVLDDIFLALKPSKRVNTTYAAYQALKYIMTSYGSSSLWNYIITKLVDSMKPICVDNERISLIVQAYDMFHANWCQTRLSDLILNRAVSKINYNDDLMPFVQEIEYALSALEMKTIYEFKVIRFLIGTGPSAFMFNIAASLLNNYDNSDMLFRSTVIPMTLRINNEAYSVGFLRYAYKLIPHITYETFSFLNEQKHLLKVLNTKLESNFYWGCKYIVQVFKYFGSEIKQQVPDIINEIENIKLKNEMFFRICLIPVACALHIYCKNESTLSIASWAIKTFQMYDQKAFLHSIDHDQSNFTMIRLEYLSALDAMIQYDFKGRNGHSFNDSFDHYCSQMLSYYDNTDVYNSDVINMLLEIYDHYLAKSRILTQNMETLLIIIKSIPKFKKRSEQLYNIAESIKNPK